MIIDFYADTKTRPSRAMREAVLDCVVGDEQKDEDPTTRALCDRVAQLLGKEAAVFLPSGTMCNEIAIRLHTEPGDEIICDYSSHIVNYEAGAPAAFSGVMIRTVHGPNGVFSAAQVAEAIRPASRYLPKTALLCVEQTANLGGGTVWPVETLDEVARIARAAGVATHMDGARLLNAAVKSGIDAARHARDYDTVWIDFTKGLGAPIGAVLAGSAAHIEKAWRLKQRFGGAMRQSGIAASMCLYALDHNVERLADDHALASWLGARIGALGLVERVVPVETNIVIFDLKPEAPTAAEVVEALRAQGVLVGAFGTRRIRVVTHIDVDRAGGEALMAALAQCLAGGAVPSAALPQQA
ncbi:GntG family PLP-dependent aldolase [Frigidibacter sp. MR17.14]|uniref:threonine aldolase family protein n=1 Tax=Frigidibacter sp. MR17.14 TaxID=3126509 RepID=UPI003012F25B